MPVASSLRELIDAIQAKKTNTTRALDDLFGSQAALDRVNAHPNRGEIDRENAFVSGPNGRLPTWAQAELAGAGSLPIGHKLKPVEIQHINDWPADNKEALRVALKAALEANSPEPIEFFWELYDGDEESIVIEPGKITFLSPKSKAMLSGPGAGSTTITVKVGA